ncbi:MAG: helix-turn-helix domain-containing protein [Candidatus Aminicenantes bacterium]|nr:helix-turn-helix domain-containing protein [Candidatus Aminicenantes bacterium]
MMTQKEKNMTNRLRLGRYLRSMSQAQLAYKAGVDASVICRIEKGYRKPSQKLREELSKILELNHRWLFPQKAMPSFFRVMGGKENDKSC